MGKNRKNSVEKEDVDLNRVEEILDHYEGVDGCLIPVLQKIQERYGYLIEPAIDIVSERLNISTSEIVGVATFYSQFHLRPRGKHIIKVCCGTACHVKNAKGLSAKVVDTFKVRVGETTADKMFTFEEVSCLGACGIAPVVVIDKEVHGTQSPDKLGAILDGYKAPVVK